MYSGEYNLVPILVARVRVIMDMGGVLASILFVDYGDFHVSDADEMFPLEDPFRTLPPQAYKASCIGVYLKKKLCCLGFSLIFKCYVVE